jgi:hypothetical protein
MSPSPHFARRVFLIAGIYGIIVLLPQYFAEAGLGPEITPPLTHPEHFYGFIGVALAWQFAFLVIARDVRRYRMLMLPAVLEKLSFGVAALALYGSGRTAGLVAFFGGIDLILGALFAAAFWSLRGAEKREDDREVRGVLVPEQPSPS